MSTKVKIVADSECSCFLGGVKVYYSNMLQQFIFSFVESTAVRCSQCLQRKFVFILVYFLYHLQISWSLSFTEKSVNGHQHFAMFNLCVHEMFIFIASSARKTATFMG